MLQEKVKIIKTDKVYEEYRKNETGVLVAFCRGGNNTPYAVVRKPNKKYVMVELSDIEYDG